MQIIITPRGFACWKCNLRFVLRHQCYSLFPQLFWLLPGLQLVFRCCRSGRTNILYLYIRKIQSKCREFPFKLCFLFRFGCSNNIFVARSVSFIFVTGGMAFLLLTFCYVTIDVLRWWNGAPFCYPGEQEFPSEAMRDTVYMTFPCFSPIVKSGLGTKPFFSVSVCFFQGGEGEGFYS